MDRGYGDYQLERLHIYGEQHPETNLKKKVLGWQFKNTLDVYDPITKEKHKEPLKQFMVNQLSLTIERDRLILSPFDEILHKQLVDYSVDHTSPTGLPIYTSKEEHFVDALGLAHLAFVLKFPKITGAIKELEFSSKMAGVEGALGGEQGEKALRDISAPINAWSKADGNPYEKLAGWEPGARKGDYQYWTKVPITKPSKDSLNRRRSTFSGASWGGRGGGFSGRSMW